MVGLNTYQCWNFWSSGICHCIHCVQWLCIVLTAGKTQMKRIWCRHAWQTCAVRRWWYRSTKRGWRGTHTMMTKMARPTTSD